MHNSFSFNFKDSDTALAPTINDNLGNIMTTNDHSPFPFGHIDYEEVKFSSCEVFDVLSEINEKKSSSDVLPNKIIKLLAFSCCNVITHIFNHICHEKIWPIEWKKADVIPLPKTSPPDFKNIRPISVLSTLNKCLEQLFKTRILPHYLKYIDACQFGFIPSGSTSSALIAILHKAYSLLDNVKIVAISLISFDIRKAFDRVNHSLLLSKLSKILPHNFVSILASYLSQRKQRVKINNSYSKYININCGVPQGSVLSPILFGFFISDLQTFNSSSCFKYADDSTFVIPHFKQDITPDIKEVANHMLKWCTANKLELNFAKTQLLTVKKSQNIIYTEINSIKQMENIKILGITLNKNLKWDNNTLAKTKSASSYLYLFRKFRNVLFKLLLRNGK